MSAWAGGNFENDNALNRVYALVRRLVAQIDKALAKPPRDSDRLYDISEQVLCHVELVTLIGRHVFEPASFRWPIGSDMLPPVAQVRAWKAGLLTAWDAGVDKDDAVPGYLAQRRKAMRDGFDQLIELIRWQEANVKSVRRAYMERVVRARVKADRQHK